MPFWDHNDIDMEPQQNEPFPIEVFRKSNHEFKMNAWAWMYIKKNMQINYITFIAGIRLKKIRNTAFYIRYICIFENIT